MSSWTICRWQTMQDVVRMFSKLSVEFMISEGSLLHLYRNCSLGQSDLDFLIPLSWWNRSNSQRLKASLEEGGFTNPVVFGELEQVGYEESWLRHDVKVKITSVLIESDYLLAYVRSISSQAHFLKIEKHAF